MWSIYPEIRRDSFVGHHGSAMIFDIGDDASDLAIALTKETRRSYNYYAF